MTVSNSEGTQTAVISTEHTLGTITPDGTYQLQIDMNAHALGDVTIVREKQKVGAAGTTRLVESYRYTHVQAAPVKLFIPRPSTNEVVYTIQQTAGTGRAFPWEIVQLDA